MAQSDERRRIDGRPPSALRRSLNENQLLTLIDLEKLGWELKFIRRPMFDELYPVVFDPDRKHYAVLKPDGTLDESPGFEIRR
jgi:hypothetical protein